MTALDVDASPRADGKEEFFESPLGSPLGESTESLDFVVATPSSSWTLLEAIMDKDTTEAESSDDGLAMEERRLEEVSELLEEIEREAPALKATAEDVAFADEAVVEQEQAQEEEEEEEPTAAVEDFKPSLGLRVIVLVSVLLLASQSTVRTMSVILPAPSMLRQNCSVADDALGFLAARGKKRSVQEVVVHHRVTEEEAKAKQEAVNASPPPPPAPPTDDSFASSPLLPMLPC